MFRTQFARCPLDGTQISDLDGDPLVGTVIDGRYRIDSCIGEGAMGRVYKAQHTRMSRSYAIKVLFGDHAGDERMRSRFAREAEGVSRLNHPNLISVVDFGETGQGLLYLVMDLAVGKPLAKHISTSAPFPRDDVVDILHQLCSGLAHAHDRGLVHRDFKGENVILVEDQGHSIAKILDFGICMIVEEQNMATMLTSNGMVVGTPAMMAPEQAAGDTVDHRSDLFSLGVVLYQMLAGKLPFDGSPLDMARKNLYEKVPPIAERSGHHVDPVLEGIAMKLLEKRPENRYQSAHEVMADLYPFFGSGSAPSLRTPLPRSGTTSPGARAVSSADTVLSQVSITEMSTTPEGRPRRFLSFVVLTIAIGCAVGLGYLLANRDSVPAKDPSAVAAAADSEVNGAEVPADLTPDPASGAQPTVTVDAAQADEPEEIQTAEPEEEAETTPPPAKKKKSEPKRSARRRSERKSQTKRQSPESDPPDEDSMLKTFESEVALLTKAIEHLGRAKGQDAFRKYKAKMDSTGYMRAFTVSSKRPAMIRKLRALRREVQSQL